MDIYIIKSVLLIGYNIKFKIKRVQLLNVDVELKLILISLEEYLKVKLDWNCWTIYFQYNYLKYCHI